MPAGAMELAEDPRYSKAGGIRMQTDGAIGIEMFEDWSGGEAAL